MKKEERSKSREGQAAELRRRAEQCLREQKLRPLESLAEADLRAVVHELQVHQIELEMQNEELQRARLAVQEMSDRYSDLFEFAPIGYFLWDEHGSIVALNLAGAALLGLDRSAAVRKRMGQFLRLQDRPAFAEFCQRVLRAESKQSCEVGLLRGEQKVDLLIEAVPTEDRQAGQRLCRAVVLDITERRRADRLKRLMDISQVALAETSLERLMQRIVDAACELIGGSTGTCAYGYRDGSFTLEARCPAAVAPASGKRIPIAAGAVYAQLLGKAGVVHLSREQVLEGRASPGQPPTSGLLAATLIAVDGRLVGLIALSDKKGGGDFSEEDELLLGQVAAMVSIRLRHIEARNEAERRAGELATANRALQAEMAAHLQAEEALGESRQRLGLAAGAGLLGLFDWNMLTNECVWTSEQELMFGNEPAEPTQTYEDWIRRLHPDDRPRVEELVRECAGQRKILECEFRVLWPDASLHWVSTRAQFFYDAEGRAVRMLGTAIDTTERKRAMDELEAAELAAELASQAKSQLVANISHELRTPMNAILGMTELALGEQLGASVREYLQTAKESADTLLDLLNEILDFSRMEAGKFQLEPTLFNLRATVEQSLRTVGMRADEKGLELMGEVADDVPDELLGDPLRLRQILLNLVGNAIKFTQQGAVVVNVRVDARTDEEVTLEFVVSDTGIGISPDDQARIFAPFTQADASATRRYRGTGLGLTISRNLVHLMGGRIWLKSAAGVGSTFSFTARLRLLPASGRVSADEVPAMRQLQGLKTLIVADNLTSRHNLEQILTGWGMHPDVAPDVPSALAKIHGAAAAGEPLALALIDVRLPGIDGFTLAKGLRNEPRRMAAVVVLSAIDRHAWGRQYEELGIVRAHKPISQADLFQAVSCALSFHAQGGKPAARPSDRGTRAARPLRVLLTEDTPPNQKLVAWILNKRGHVVEIANNGAEAVERASREDFDLILMDVQMPVMDGFQATAILRARAPADKPWVPIVAMTAHAAKGDAQRCLAAGMDGYLAKPITAQELVEVVERLAKPGQARTNDPAAAEGEESREAAAQPSPPVVPSEVLDLDEAWARCLGRPEMLREMVEYFHTEVAELPEKLHAALVQGDADAVARAAHRLRTTLLYLGAHPAQDAAEHAERLARSGDMAETARAIEGLEGQIGLLKEALATLRQPAAAGDSA